jgi:molecular chaperone DnaJ
MPSPDYYEVLGISKNADDREIKKAYRNLARKYHPDVCKDAGAEERFKEINEAYSVLADSQKRAQYDNLGHENYTSASKGSYTGAGGFSGGGFSADVSGFGDIFDFFGGSFGGSRRAGPQAGNDLLMKIAINLEDAVTGTDREIEVLHTEACTTCNGTGSETKRRSQCGACGGTGQIRQMSQSVFGQFVRMSTCNQCQGTGKVPEKRCTACKGSGHQRIKRKVSIHIPAGIDTGMRLRMEGYGEAGEYGATNGDLFVEVHVKAHDRFTRSGDTLETIVAVSPAQAILGSNVEIETIDHRHVDLVIPAGVQYNTALKIPGEGVRRRGRPGDLLVRVKVAIPKSISPEEHEIYQKLLEIEGKKSPEEKKGFFSGIMGKKKK